MPIKRYITMALARFDGPKEIARLVKDEFDITVLPQQVQLYNPTLTQGKDLSTELRTLFFDTRKRFIDEIEVLPFAHLAVRLHRLEHAYQAAAEMNNTKGMLAAIEGARRAMQAMESYDDGQGDSDGHQV